jgi:hypothetical protein
MRRHDAASTFAISAQRSALTALFVWLLCMLHSPAIADALDGVLEVRSAYVNVDRGVFLLHARVEYPDNPMIEAALHDGVSLTFDLDIRVDRERRLWFSANLMQLSLRRTLSYHAVSNRYVVRDLRGGGGQEQQTFATLEDALAYLGKIDGLPILVEPQVDAGNYVVSVRAGVRRGRLPAGLRSLLFWTNDWHRVSEWYSWALPV